MRALLIVASQARGQWVMLLAGLLITLAGTLVAVALSGVAGAMMGATGLVLSAPLLLRLLGPARVVLRYFERLVSHDALFRAQADMRVWFFRGLAARMAGGLGMQREGDVLARLVGDVETQDVIYMRLLLPLVGAMVLLPLLLVLIGGIDPALALLVGLLLILAGLVLPWAAARGSLAAGDRLARGMAGLRIAALDALHGLREVRAFGAEANCWRRSVVWRFAALWRRPAHCFAPRRRSWRRCSPGVDWALGRLLWCSW